MEKILNIPITIGRRAIKFWDGVLDFIDFIKAIINSLKSIRYLSLRAIYTIIVNQIRFTGIHALPFILFIAILIGGTVIIQAMTRLPKFGVESFIGDLLVVIIARELGPLITALIVITRSGSAMATEIATQKSSREIESLEIMGIDTKLYIVFPRIISAILSIFALIIIFDIAAFLGGYIISQSAVYIPPDIFLQAIIDSFNFKDLLSAVIKSLISGILIPLISCYYGFMPVSKFEIPIYVSRAVIRTLASIFVINAIISILFYF
jgi:phospholipid/cholesterol/gamma-HCH transport system permease protein